MRGAVYSLFLFSARFSPLSADEHTLSELCIELVKLQVPTAVCCWLQRSDFLFFSSQEYIKTQGLKVVVIFEGRDAAGKGGVISRIASASAFSFFSSFDDRH